MTRFRSIALLILTAVLLAVPVGAQAPIIVLPRASLTIGDILYANTSSTFQRLAAPAAGQVFTSAGIGTAPAWSASPNLSGCLTFGVGGATDTWVCRNAAAVVNLGTSDAAAPVAQTLRMQSVVAGTADTAGTAFTVAGSVGTGTGVGGNIAFTVAPPGLAGNAQNAAITQLTVSGALAGDVTLHAGGSAAGVARLGGVIHANLTPATSSQNAKQTLMTFALPANTLNVNGRCLRIKFFGSCKNSADNKTQAIDFGGTTVASTGSVLNNNGAWEVNATVCRTAAGAQVASGAGLSVATPLMTSTAPAENEAGAITITGNATEAATADGTTAKGLLIELLN